MIFDKWKSMVSQKLASDFMDASLKGTTNGISEASLQEAFDKFSHDEAIQFKAYATYDAELPEDLTKLLQICKGV